MDDQIIERLFEQVSKNYDNVPEEAHKFFKMFVQETLDYRDELAEAGLEPLKVGEVQEALNCLEQFLYSQNFSENISPRAETLLKRWIEKVTEPKPAS